MGAIKWLKYRVNDLRESGRAVRGRIERYFIRNDDFCIISNNCWGGWVYRYYGLPYSSPTVGNFIISEDYVRFVRNLKYYLSLELQIIDPEDAHRAEDLKTYVELYGRYPVGRLADVDIHFLHDTDAATAKEKWERRTERVNFNKILVKYSTQNLWTMEDCRAFSDWDFPNKIIFAPGPMEGIQDVVVFKKDEGLPETRNEGEEYWRYINMTSYIRNMKETGNYF